MILGQGLFIYLYVVLLLFEKGLQPGGLILLFYPEKYLLWRQREITRMKMEQFDQKMRPRQFALDP